MAVSPVRHLAVTKDASWPGQGAATDLSRKPNDTHRTAKWPPTAFPHALPPAAYIARSVKLFIQRDDAAGALLAVTLAGAVLVE